jgi:hypothetical protein
MIVITHIYCIRITVKINGPPQLCVVIILFLKYLPWLTKLVISVVEFFRVHLILSSFGRSEQKVDNHSLGR